MSDIAERVRKVMETVQKVHVLATVDAEGKPHMRWMGAIVEDPEKPWTFYLACGKDSRKMRQLAANSNAQLLFSQMDDWLVATLSGTAQGVDTPQLRQLLWDAVPAMQKYYSGIDDPTMGIIKFTTSCLELLAMQERHEPYCLVL